MFYERVCVGVRLYGVGVRLCVYHSMEPIQVQGNVEINLVYTGAVFN